MALLSAPNPTSARKRRKDILASLKSSKRRGVCDEKTSKESISISESTIPVPINLIMGNKYLNRYEPSVPMTKEDKSAWRKEERKHRNRASAAASRNKVRNRIHELETEVQVWQTKYTELMTRIEVLESANTGPSCNLGASPSFSSPYFHPAISLTPAIPKSASIIHNTNDEEFSTVPLITEEHSICRTSDYSSAHLSSESIDSNIPHPENVTNQDLHVIEITSRPA